METRQVILKTPTQTGPKLVSRDSKPEGTIVQDKGIPIGEKEIVHLNHCIDL